MRRGFDAALEIVSVRLTVRPRVRRATRVVRYSQFCNSLASLSVAVWSAAPRNLDKSLNCAGNREKTRTLGEGICFAPARRGTVRPLLTNRWVFCLLQVFLCVPFKVASSVVMITTWLAADAVAATISVNAGADLQAALNAAQPGDTLVLQAGARFVGKFTLPAKAAGPVITIQSSATLPNRRIGPGDANLLPTLAQNVISAILNGTGAANWKLDGIRLESVLNGQGEVIVLQNSTNIYMDRLLIVAGANGQKRGIRGNGQQITLTRSYIANIWRVGQDSQAFCAWDGAGPYTITNNYLEAASENVLFGGADSLSPDRVPSDILVEGNYFTKRLEWRGQGVECQESVRAEGRAASHDSRQSLRAELG